MSALPKSLRSALPSDGRSPLPSDYLPPTPDDAMCCMGAAAMGRCTCWRPIYSEQAPPLVDLPDAPIAAEVCEGCAFRRGSAADIARREELLPAERSPSFYCHRPMRRVLGYEHKVAGERVMLPTDIDMWSHEPLRVDERLFAADGTPAPLCRGWAARKGLLGEAGA